MASHWGVDSLQPTNTVLSGVKGKPTLFQFVCDQAGQVPAFWGRYITKLQFKDKKGKLITFPKLEKKEAEFIFNASGGHTRILPIYNLAHGGKSSLGGGQAQGENDAQKAIGAADALGIPAGVFLWCDIEPGMKASATWFPGWWKVMLNSKYGGRGGIYENPLKHNARNFATPYLQALKGQFGFVVADPLSSARLLWSQQPCRENAPIKPIPKKFHPAEPEGVSGTTVVWQYAIDCLRLGGPKGSGHIDFDLANDLGLSVMWKGHASAPKQEQKHEEREREPLMISTG